MVCFVSDLDPVVRMPITANPGLNFNPNFFFFSSKTFSRTIKLNLSVTFMTHCTTIYSRQSGFRRKHSTETALLKIINELLFNLDKDRVSGMVLVDYRKAFEMVDQELLLRKLKVNGVSNQELS